MGEYATYKGGQIKIGTCEDMYYLRHDQRRLVKPESGSVAPASDDRFALRFRFPWPDEDTIEPGAFENYHRAITVYGDVAVPGDVDHYSVQFCAQVGYLVSLPCPESVEGRAVSDTFKVHRNGFQGAVRLVAQKELAMGWLVPILRCGGCGAMWRVEDTHEIEAIAVAFRSQADNKRREQARRGDTGDGWVDSGAFCHTIADRVLAGITASV